MSNIPAPPAAHARLAAALCALLAAASLGGCSNETERAFGLGRNSPDEFTVTTRAPLSMPPTYALRPPRPGAPRPQESTSIADAEAALTPQAALQGPGGPPTAGQQALMEQAGAPAPPDIRRKVDDEAYLERPDTSLSDRLMFWRDKPEPGVIVDPTKESQRLRENAALGKSEETGSTPIFAPPKPTLLDRIF
jgi:hypothetical protein